MVGLPHSLHAVVTGAARGIGREIASRLTQRGCTSSPCSAAQGGP